MDPGEFNSFLANTIFKDIPFKPLSVKNLRLRIPAALKNIEFTNPLLQEERAFDFANGVRLILFRIPNMNIVKSFGKDEILFCAKLFINAAQQEADTSESYELLIVAAASSILKISRGQQVSVDELNNVFSVMQEHIAILFPDMLQLIGITAVYPDGVFFIAFRDIVSKTTGCVMGFPDLKICEPAIK